MVDELPRKAAKKKTVLRSHAAPPPRQADQPPADTPPVLLTPDLLYNRERAYALEAAERFERWLLTHVAEQRIPMDLVIRQVTILTWYVRYFLLARVEWPELYLLPDADEHWMPATEAEAIAVGLSIDRPRRRPKPTAAMLPGCKGMGGACLNLRQYGERFCPGCRRVELERLRAQEAN